MEKEQLERLKRAAVWETRCNQFWWGWMWFGATNQAIELVIEPSYFHVVLLALFATAGMYYGRKVKSVPISFK